MLKKCYLFFLIALFFAGINSIKPELVYAGLITDNYQEIKDNYPQFFEELLATNKTNEEDIYAWLEDLDAYLVNYVLNEENFSKIMTNAVLNTLLADGSESVYYAVSKAYGEEMSDALKGILPEDFEEFYRSVKEIILSNMINAAPPAGEIKGYTVDVELSAYTRDAEIYYTTDGSKPTSDKTRYTEPVVLDLTGGPQTLKAVSFKNDVYSDPLILIYEMARGSLKGKVRLEGVSANKNLVATLLGKDGQQVDLEVQSNGEYLLEEVEPDIYSITFSAPRHKSKEVEVEIEPGETTTIPEVILLAGDLDGNQKIDLEDLKILAGVYGSQSREADLNGDSRVSLKDLLWLVKNYGR